MASLLRFLVVSSYYHPAAVFGGPVQSIKQLNAALSRLGHKVTVYTTDADGTGDLAVPRGQPVPVDGVPVTYFPRCWFGREKKPFNLFFSVELKKALGQIKRGDFDLIRIHSTWGEPGRLAAAAARRAGIPYIFYTHGVFEPWALRHRYWKKRVYWELIEKRVLSQAGGIVVCNEAETQQLRGLGLRTPIRRLPWGVDLTDPATWPSHNDSEQLFPDLKNRPFILFLSRLHPKKGLDLLIPAFASLGQDFPDWVLVLAGPAEGNYRAQLDNMIIRLGIKERVIFPGLVTGKAKAALLAHASLFILPSYSEGFPVVITEALGYGRPLIITTSCYIPEVKEHGAGLIVPPDKNSITIALREMMGDAGLRESCSQNAIRLAASQFTWERVATKTIEFYEWVGQTGNI